MVPLMNHSVDEMVRLIDGGAVINYQKHAVDICIWVGECPNLVYLDHIVDKYSLSNNDDEVPCP